MTPCNSPNCRQSTALSPVIFWNHIATNIRIYSYVNSLYKVQIYSNLFVVLQCYHFVGEHTCRCMYTSASAKHWCMWPHGIEGPCGPKFINLGIDVQQGPCYQNTRAHPPNDNPSTRYLLPNFVHFFDGVTDNNSKRHVTADNNGAIGATESFMFQLIFARIYEWE